MPPTFSKDSCGKDLRGKLSKSIIINFKTGSGKGSFVFYMYKPSVHFENIISKISYYIDCQTVISALGILSNMFNIYR